MREKDIYISRLHNNFVIIKTDNEYIISIIGNNIVAACLIEKKIIFINKNETTFWDDEHYLSIEAHEISHYISNHTKVNDIKSEKDADKMAYFILNYYKHFKAAKLIKDRFEEQYNILIEDYNLSIKLKIKLFLFFVKKLLHLDVVEKIYNSKNKKLCQKKII